MRPLRVGVLCSRRAPGLTYLLEQDANRRRLYDVVCCLTSEESFAEEAVAGKYGIPVIAHAIRQFCRGRGCRLSDPIARRAYDTEMVERLVAYDVDLIVLASYLYVLSEPMLSSFRHRIVNIHHSDLTLLNADGSPSLSGLRAVRDALLKGLDETRATAHLVTKQLDQGPPFLRSWAFPVSPLVAHALTNQAGDVLKAYAYAHQEWMIRATWGPLAAAAIDLVARGCLDLAQLAGMSNRESPWELGEDGKIRGQGPLQPAHASLQMAWVS